MVEDILEANKMIVSLQARISELELLLLSRSPKKHSHNSHVPPSTDLSRKSGSLREKSDKKIGGQPNHPGSTLEMSSTPEIITDIYPTSCTVCGSALSKETHSFELIGRRQVIDIPPIRPITTEYRVYSTTCKCGHEQVGHFPEGVNSHVQYGTNIQSLTVYNSSYQFMPFQRLQRFFKDICNVSLSQGTLVRIISRTAEKATDSYEAIRTTLSVSFFVGSDETGFKVAGKKGWFWVWQNDAVTYIKAALSRSKSVITDVFPEGLPQSILCSDRLAAQLSTISKGNQVCLAHLLRDLNFLIETEKTSWASQFKTILQDAIALKQAKKAYATTDPCIVALQARTDALLSLQVLGTGLNDPPNQRKTVTFFRGMIKLQGSLFPFLFDERIPFDNNGSERAIRNVKVKMKVSGQFLALQQPFAVIRSVIDTAIKQRTNVWTAINTIVNIKYVKPIPAE